MIVWRGYDVLVRPARVLFFFFNDTATTEIYTLSLHDALPISSRDTLASTKPAYTSWPSSTVSCAPSGRSEEHTSELQSQSNLVCRLLLEKKKIDDSLNDTGYIVRGLGVAVDRQLGLG